MGDQREKVGEWSKKNGEKKIKKMPRLNRGCTNYWTAKISQRMDKGDR